MTLAPLLCALLQGCSDYGLNKGDGLDTGTPGPADSGPDLPDIEVTPLSWDFGTLDLAASAELEIAVRNVGEATLNVLDLEYERSSGELALDRLSGENGSLPWRMEPGDGKRLLVGYHPADAILDTGTLRVSSNDPDEATVEAVQAGNGREFEGFSTGWYVWDEGVAYETTSNRSHEVDHHGDEDLYWYEPSGAHGLVDSPDPVADFAVLRQYVLDHAGAPVEPSGPFSYDADSDLDTFEWATFTYFLCDFYLPPDDDPALYAISSGTVDDGIQVMVNGAILGRIELGQSGSWPLSNAVPGAVNSLVIILVDDSHDDKYVNDLAFYRDGVMVEG